MTRLPDHAIPRLIKGGWQLAGGHGPVDRGAALRDMRAYFDAGITAFDCADIYAGVEELIGEFLRTVPRERVRVHTKCVPDLERLGTLQPSDIAATVARSRERLGLEAIDLVQLHWWDYHRGDFVAAAQMLDALRRDGVLRDVGLTNFGTPELRQIVDAGVPVAAHQVQYSLLDRRPAAAMASYCAGRGIGLLCYGALAGGFFHERWLGAAEPALPLENRSLVKYKLIIDECGGWARFQQLLTVLAEVGASHQVSIGAIAVRWVLDQRGVHSVIVGARSAAHLASTVAALHVSLGAEDRARIEGALAELVIPPGDVYELERDRQGRHGRIMRYDLQGERGERPNG